MTEESVNVQAVIRAAGGLLWRETAQGYEIAVIHRRRYDDWTLPKGKVNEGESWLEAAVREVKEETGCAATVLGFAGAIAYNTDRGPKLVKFWHMKSSGTPSPHIDEEVAEVCWLSVESARDRLQHPLERALVEVWRTPEALAVSSAEPCLPTHSAGFARGTTTSWVRAASRRLHAALHSEAERRLRCSIADSKAWWCRVKSLGPPGNGGWVADVDNFRDLAEQALEMHDIELGWHYLKASNRRQIDGLTGDDLQARARSVLRESSDKEKEVAPWRQQVIAGLLCDSAGELRQDLTRGQVVQAVKVLDEHFDNVYGRLTIVGRRLRSLSVLGSGLLVGWILLSDCLEVPSGDVLAGIAWRPLFWTAVSIAGALGATISGFLSSIGGARAKIPSELGATTVAYARLAMGALAGVAVSILLSTGLINLGKFSFELAMAAALVAGSSERFLTKALEAVEKK